MQSRTLASLLCGGITPARLSADLALTLLRVTTGLLMAPHGWGKLPVSAELVTNVGAMGFPVPTVSAWAAALSEFIGGLLLAAGLFTRISAFMIACTMAGAVLVAHAGDPLSAREMALLYLVISIGFVVHGSGRFGLDRLARSR
ncbi:MAG: DoxX family protein [Phycisphaeraceae bacterium]|nr:DoxX family protein [Phycisphaeraceae bacterium]